MKKILYSERIPLMLWLDDLDGQALEQARNLANLPAAFHHVAIMADAHVGYGMPIGGVLATLDVIIPNAVGVDIGCGVCAVRTGLARVSRQELKAIVGALRTTVPLGFRHHARPRPAAKLPELPLQGGEERLPVVWREFEHARSQLGTLGGGNHFLEIQQGSDQAVWLMVHSGSRNLGHTVATSYNRLAEQQAGAAAKRQQLAQLSLQSEEGQRYFEEMAYCRAFARANRGELMARFREIVAEETGCSHFAPPLDVAHNYAALEEHFGRQVVVHRKGATAARAGHPGVIPGSQGSASYIVSGLGNPDAFASCSHGAGRRLGRRQAKRRLDLGRERQQLEEQQIIHSLRSRRDLDEAPGAYKDIEQVMAAQADLVEIRVRLAPLAVVKG
ncbi:RtcB family protein [Desulfogranum mediterraneum]|uniref:RtcB family protein n=1 Tax=Desulfogranum mediterraneum TaxID=160661 RepID=UPI00041D71C1|nr:RtcB family protein [Desulfogranum mediterraneum]